jgi:hypothetical protein
MSERPTVRFLFGDDLHNLSKWEVLPKKERTASHKLDHADEIERYGGQS